MKTIAIHTAQAIPATTRTAVVELGSTAKASEVPPARIAIPVAIRIVVDIVVVMIDNEKKKKQSISFCCQLTSTTRMAKLKFAAKKENIGIRVRGEGLQGNKVLLAGNRPGKPVARPPARTAITRNEKDALANIARAAALAVARPAKKKKKVKKEEKEEKEEKGGLAASEDPIVMSRATPRATPRAASSRADLPRSEAALRAVGRPPPRSPDSSSMSSSSSSVASSAGVSSVGSSVSSSSRSGSSGSSLSSSSSGSRSSGSSSSISLSSLSTVSPVPRDKGFDVLRRGDKSTARVNEEEEAERIDILARFHALKQRGLKLSKNYTARSSLGDLRLEMGRIEHESTVQRSVQRLRRWLLAFVSGAQFASDSRYAPRFVHGKLNGFSDYVLASVEDYDSIFERISEEHGGAGGIGSTGSPMLDLGILIGTQLLMFVFMNSKPGVKPPSADEIRRDHPDLVRQVASELAAEMRNRERFEERVAAQQPPPPPPPSYGGGQPQRRTMPAPSYTFAGLQPDSIPPRANDETLTSLHQSTLPQRPWVSVGETLLPEPEPIDDAPRELPPPTTNESLPLIVATPLRTQAETYPVDPPVTKKFVELNESALSTRRGRTVKPGPAPKPNTLDQPAAGKVIEIN